MEWLISPVFYSSIEQLRAERLQREAEERRRAKALLDQRNGKGKEKEVTERERPYNSAYFPELARKRQRRDRDSWRDEILKSWTLLVVWRVWNVILMDRYCYRCVSKQSKSKKDKRNEGSMKVGMEMWKNLYPGHIIVFKLTKGQLVCHFFIYFLTQKSKFLHVVQRSGSAAVTSAPAEFLSWSRQQGRWLPHRGPEAQARSKENTQQQQLYNRLNRLYYRKNSNRL